MWVKIAMPLVMFEMHTTPSGQKIPVNSEGNRMRASRDFVARGDATMTPVMCGFWLQALALDKDSNDFKDARVVAGRLHATYEDEGMQFHLAMASAMRIKAEQPALFKRMAAGN